MGAAVFGEERRIRLEDEVCLSGQPEAVVFQMWEHGLGSDVGRGIGILLGGAGLLWQEIIWGLRLGNCKLAQQSENTKCHIQPVAAVQAEPPGKRSYVRFLERPPTREIDDESQFQFSLQSRQRAPERSTAYMFD